MGTKIYKYFSAEALDLALPNDESCAVKCSFPKDYNDPFELFLSVDHNSDPELLAVYREIVFEIPQLPTTCFSRSPIITPMWAHYAKNHSGFVLEFDQQALSSAFPEAGIRDVTYRNEPDPRIGAALLQAAVTKKPRHAIWLREGVMSAAYFSKHSCWAYEEECRVVVSEDDIVLDGQNMILHIPVEAVTSILIGKNFPDNLVEKSKALAESRDLTWYCERIGKSHPLPFFISSDGTTSAFGENGIEPSENACETCDEPIAADRHACSWCSIEDGHEVEAALGNPLRMLYELGQLDEYMREFRNLGRPKKP